MGSLQLKRVLITGAAGGLGRTLAKHFAAEGCELVLTDLHEEPLEATRTELSQSGTRCRAYVLDVTDDAAIQDVRRRVHEDLGAVDILVNNAGVVFGGPFLEVPLEQHRLTYRVNVEGVVAMTHAFLPDLMESSRGHLTFIASASGFIGLPNGSTYASSKWAVIGFAESIRAELKARGTRHVGVTTVCPTYIDTGMFTGAKPPKTAKMLDPDEIAKKIVEAVRKEQIWVLEPWIVKVTPFIKNCLPTKIADFVADAFGASSSMDQWQGHGS
ncbi:MAG: SDR family oxidoreductase [Thermoanaerobaculia bacterium]|nr:SDR family oxidoreductase [Thermoanaerobaculia bacterium]